MFNTIRSLAARATSTPLTSDPSAEALLARYMIDPTKIPGIRVNSRSGIAYPAVWRCINVISGTVAGMPWRLEQDVDGGRVTVPNDPVDLILSRMPNDEMGPFTFTETLLSHALGWGDGYAEIETTLAGVPAAMWNITPDRVKSDRVKATGQLVYDVSNSGAANTVLPASRMFHLKGLGFDGVHGYSPIELHARTIAHGRAADRFGEQFFLGGGRPFGILTYAGAKLKPEVMKRLMRLFGRRLPGMGGSKVGGGTVPLPGSWDYKPVSTDPKSAAMIEARKFQREEVALIYGVPPHMVGGDDPSLANIEHRRIEFATSTLMPWVTRLEQEADIKLVGRRRLAQGFRTNIAMSGLLRADTITRANYYRFLAATGALSINEIRQGEGLSSIGTAGDVRLVQEQMTPLDILERIKLAKSGAPASARSNSRSNDSLVAVDLALAFERNEIENRLGSGVEVADAVLAWSVGAEERVAQRLEHIDPNVAGLAGLVAKTVVRLAREQVEGVADAEALRRVVSRWPEGSVSRVA